ncbi:hypothetical protein GEV43_32545 [Actinomadura sp. J1-007]|nr:hypothetical protein [Actinomadura sp. J1-007]
MAPVPSAQRSQKTDLRNEQEPGGLPVPGPFRHCEAGTFVRAPGTGWTAALLTEFGAGILSVEVDPAVADQAAANLKAAGHAPRLVVGDGAAGWPPGAPYDRVHATAAVARVPYPWVEQTRLRGGSDEAGFVGGDD